jgi:hypothetical protein
MAPYQEDPGGRRLRVTLPIADCRLQIADSRTVDCRLPIDSEDCRLDWGLAIGDWHCGLAIGIADWRLALRISDWHCGLAIDIADWRLALRIGDWHCGLVIGIADWRLALRISDWHCGLAIDIADWRLVSRGFQSTIPIDNPNSAIPIGNRQSQSTIPIQQSQSAIGNPNRQSSIGNPVNLQSAIDNLQSAGAQYGRYFQRSNHQLSPLCSNTLSPMCSPSFR